MHGINEVIERVAMSLLIIEQFLTPDRPRPLRVTDPATLPAPLAALHATAEHRIGRPVSLLEMTTDLGIPAYWAFVSPAVPGTAARVRGAGASLNPRYAAECALSELIQAHTMATRSGHSRVDHTRHHPALNCCSPHLGATTVPFPDAPAPATPEEHLRVLLSCLTANGFTAWAWRRYSSADLAVVNVHIPGLERFVLVTNGQFVLPGSHGLASRHPA
ncbi:YcaO-like family protein [Streptomyces sp. Ag109_O5-1]|uniref:YcaO-like family protein n=1 Tax=Streptomyces sp. Ag109_O5-1 TaxID=1938851 RepID=UPI000F4EE404|nr:YcaO-like family protein [Streptomyces sp. Ag109_O5-1]RPE38658.1 YcaO-like family protein [Streptomyces sp. Ag109_O5-1]